MNGMYEELIEKLRKNNRMSGWTHIDRLIDEAAEAIEALQQEIERLKATIDEIKGIVGYPGEEALKKHGLTDTLPNIVRYLHREWLEQTHKAGQRCIEKDIEIDKLKDENEQLQAQVAAMKTAICNMCRGKECDNCAFGDANITETIKHWRPERVCLCGSTRFFRAFDDWNFRFTLEGKIVLTIGCNTKSDKGLGLTDEDKIKLDELHKRKIDLADWIFVIDVGGYIGSSTQSEIEYAQLHGKPIKYLSKEFPDYQEPADYHNPADVEALRKAREALDYWRELYGIGLEVLNWHMNGDIETFDSFYDSSGTYEALAEIDKAIGGKEDA